LKQRRSQIGDRRFFVAALVVLRFGAGSLTGQTLPSTGNIHGTVLDEHGAALPGVVL
jgi:hypothetical protein